MIFLLQIMMEIQRYQYKLKNQMPAPPTENHSSPSTTNNREQKRQQENNEIRLNRRIEPVIKNQLLLFLWSICIAMGSLVMGYLFVIVTVINSSITHYAQSQLSLSQKSQLNMPLYISICTTALPLGGLISSLAYNKIINKVQSQNNLMVICDILMIITIFAQLFSLDVQILTITRLLQGVIIGVSSIIIPTYLISISPTKISGKIGSLNQILITIGIALGYGMGYRINEKDLGNKYNWRLIVLLPMLMCLIRIVVCKIFPFDTIERHIQNKDWRILNEYINQFYQKGTFSIPDLIRSKNIKVNIEEKVNPQIEQEEQNASQSKQNNLNEEDSLHKRTKNNGRGSALSLYTSIQNSLELPQYSKRYGQSMGNIKIRKTLSFVLCILNQFCGINAILFYSNQLFTNISKGDTRYAVRKSLQLGIFQIGVTLISGSFMDNFGRKTLMLCGDFLIIVALLSGYYMLDFSSGTQWDPNYVTYAIFLHIGGFSLSLGPITVVYISQILEDISPYMTFIWIQTIFIALSSNIMIQYLGIGKVFLFYAVISIAGLSYVCKYMIETRGKTRNQIIQAYEKISQNKDPNKVTLNLANIPGLTIQKYAKVHSSDEFISES